MSCRPLKPTHSRVPVPEHYKAFGRVGGLGLELAAYLLIFVKGGEWLDERYATHPIFERIGVAIGLFAIFYTIWKLARLPPPEAKPDPKQEASSESDDD